MSPRVYEFISFDFKECLNHKYLLCHKNQTNAKENCNSKSNSVYLSLGIDHQDVAVCFSIFPPSLLFISVSVSCLCYFPCLSDLTYSAQRLSLLSSIARCTQLSSFPATGLKSAHLSRYMVCGHYACFLKV